MQTWQKASLIISLLLFQNPTWAGWLDSDTARLQQGINLYQQGQYDRAIMQFSMALQANPNLADAYYWRGITFSNLHQFEKALSDFDSAIKVNGNIPGYYLGRGQIYSNLGKHELAVADFDTALRLNPYLSDAQTNKNFSLAEIAKKAAGQNTASDSASSTTSSNTGTEQSRSLAYAGSSSASAASTRGTAATLSTSRSINVEDKALRSKQLKDQAELEKRLKAEQKEKEKVAAEKAASDERFEHERQERLKLEQQLVEAKRNKKWTKSQAPQTELASDSKSAAQQVASVPMNAAVSAAASVASAATADSSITPGAPAPNRPIKDKWALIIGISKFKDQKLNLHYPSKDAKDFYQFLTTQGNFAKDHVKLLVDEDATRENIMTLLGDKWLPRVANPDDLVLIYVSSHGSSSEMDSEGTNYLLAYDSNVDNLYASGLAMQDLTRMIKGRVHSDRVVMILDACHSGAASPESKGLSRGSNVNAEAIAQGTGQLVISSSETNQVSWESKKDPNSVFTKYLMEGLKQKGNKTTLEEAFQFMKDKVQEEVLRERGVLQTPVLKSKWQGSDVIIGVPPASPRAGL